MTVSGIQALLNVEDMDVSVAFYGHLGFQITESFDHEGQLEWVLMASGQARLMLNRNTKAQSVDRQKRATYSDVVFYCYVASASDTHEKLSGLGLSPGPVERQMYGLDEFIIRDPDGYCLAIASDIPKMRPDS